MDRIEEQIMELSRLTELKGQIIDVLEDYCMDNHINIDNDERDEAIEEQAFELHTLATANGDTDSVPVIDTNDFAIIYGYDYDRISYPVEKAIATFGWKMTHEQTEHVISKVLSEFAAIISERGHTSDDQPFSISRCNIRDKIRQVFISHKISA